jgi:MAF protein
MPEGSIVLASGSPRRRELIALGGWDVLVRPVQVDEGPIAGESAGALTRRLAEAKARSAFPPEAKVVLAADTLVADGNELLGKPADLRQARAMLERLRGRSHRVVTSIVLRSGDGVEVHDACESTVPMRSYGDHEIDRYLGGGGPLDKAGGYGIQDGLFEPVDRQAFDGCFANVMGLPVCHVVRSLRRLGIEPQRDVPSACLAHTRYPCRVYPQILRGDA